jgi:hypothetical protein
MLEDETKNLLAASDLVLVCVPQNLGFAERYESQIKSFLGDLKHLLIIPEYYEGYSTSSRKISEAVGIPYKKCLVLPRSGEFKDYLSRGELLTFYSKISDRKVPLFSLNEDELYLKASKSFCKRLISELKLINFKEVS